MPQLNGRISFLDSSRGLAAFAVLLAHFQLTIVPYLKDFWIFKTPLGIVLDADAAVLYFFILSGYVLTRSLVRIKTPTFHDYRSFVGKRIFRIYPAFLVTLVLTFFIVRYFGNPGKNWLSIYWKEGTDFISLIKQSILVKRLPNDPLLRILPHDWTLSIEMAVSLLLPILAFSSGLNALLTLHMVYFGVLFLGLDPFALDFSFGVFLASEQERLIKFSLSLTTKSLLFLFAIFMICSDYLFPELMKATDHLLIHHKSWGLVIVLYLMLSSLKFQRILSFQPLVFLGKISYSFYLVHLSILLIMTILFPGIDSVLFLLIYVISTVAISTISYYLIEKPFIRLGRSLFTEANG